MRRATLLVAIISATLVALMFGVPNGDAFASEGTATVLTLPFSTASFDEGCVFCDDCQIGEDEGHVAIGPSETATRDPNFGPHACNAPLEFGCGFHHPSGCEVEGDDEEALVANLEQARQHILLGNVATVRLIAAEPGDRLVYVPEREAIQVLDCKGGVMMHLPIGPDATTN